MSALETRPVQLALLAAVPVALLAAFTAAQVVPAFFDPCHTWGVGSSGASSFTPGDECPQRTASSESAAEAAVVLVAVQGGMLAGALAGGLGAWRGRVELVAAAALVMGLETGLLALAASIVALSTLVATVLFGVSAWMMHRDEST